MNGQRRHPSKSVDIVDDDQAPKGHLQQSRRSRGSAPVGVAQEALAISRRKGDARSIT
jgi:hypothetical protein